MSHVTHIHDYFYQTHVPHERVTSLVMSHVTHLWVMSNTSMGHITHIHESCHTHTWLLVPTIYKSHINESRRYVIHNQSCHTHPCFHTHVKHMHKYTVMSHKYTVMSHTSMLTRSIHLPDANKPYRTSMSHVTHICVTSHINDSCHTPP